MTASVELLCHPRTPSTAIERIQVSLERLPGSALQLSYVMSGEIARLRVPAAREPRRVDELWRHTCCELFVGSTSNEAYSEFNFSPSGEWAAYSFEGYRQGMQLLQLPDAPQIRTDFEGSSLTIDVRLGIAGIVAEASDAIFAIAAVIEETDSRVSYWSLRHGKDKPDFHDRAGFALRWAERIATVQSA